MKTVHDHKTTTLVPFYNFTDIGDYRPLPGRKHQTSPPITKSMITHKLDLNTNMNSPNDDWYLLVKNVWQAVWKNSRFCALGSCDPRL